MWRADFLPSALAFLLLFGCADMEPERPRHALLVVVDTLRADRLGSYGAGEGASPHLDAFARQARVFEHCSAHAADTRFSMASLLTGFLPHETQILVRRGLPAGLPTWARILRDAGFRTEAVVSNYVLRRGRGFEQGFDRYDDRLEEIERVRRQPERTATATTDRAIERLDTLAAGERLFLWVHYQDPHGPYTPPADLLRDGPPGDELVPTGSLSGRGGIPSYQVLGALRDHDAYVRRYEAEVRHVDREIGRLFAALERRGLRDESLIVFTSDHGEGLGEHDYYFAHGEYLYEHQTHVPLILAWGDHLTGRETIPVQHIDVLPTVLGRLGIEPTVPLPGKDLLDDPTPRAIFSVMRSPLVKDTWKFALARDHWKLIHTPRGERTELYALDVDPGEDDDLAERAEHAERRERLRARLERIRRLDRLSAGKPAAPALTPAERARLRALGYLE